MDLKFENKYWKKVIEKLDELVCVGKRLIDLGEAILNALQWAPQRQARAIQMFFQSPGGERQMALQLPVGQTDQYFVNALDAAGNAGAALATGQVIAVVSPDPSVVLTPDAVAGVDPKTGVQSAASGTVAIGPSPVIGTAVTVTATLTNADGSVADTETDTVTPLPGGAVKIGILFEDASVNPSPAGGKRK